MNPSRDRAPVRRRETSRKRAAARRAPAPVATTRLTRYVRAGEVAEAPADVTVAETVTFAEAEPDRMAMLLYPSPTEPDVRELAEAWDLHPILVDDLLHAGQRPKLERYGDVLFIVVRSAWYIDEREDVDFAEFHLLVRPGAVAVLCPDGKWIDGMPGSDLDALASEGADRRERTLLADAELLRLGPEAVVYRLLDAIVDGYVPVLQGLGTDKEQVERQVFSGDDGVAERIYRLSQEVIDLQHATSSLSEVVRSLNRGFGKYDVPDELRAHLGDVSDHLERVSARASEYREALAQILSVNATLVAQRQNEDMKKISGWAAVLFAPTLIAAVYGMNFDVMPELHWGFGYPMAVGLMVGFAGLLFGLFKWRKWM